jgi:hypothetical protein
LFIFIAKRVIIYYLLLAAADIVFIRQKWLLLIGLTAGAIFSLLRFGTNAAVYGGIPFAGAKIKVNNLSAGTVIVIYAINQIILLPLLFISYKAGMAFFEGVVAGILLVPLVLFINSITEAIRVTHNNFE